MLRSGVVEARASGPVSTAGSRERGVERPVQIEVEARKFKTRGTVVTREAVAACYSVTAG